MEKQFDFYFYYSLFTQNEIISYISFFLTFLFIGAVLALFVKGNGRKSHILLSVPSILVTTGLVGTFLGITIGLLEFDVLAIDQSIPKLLNGLKIAFLTSVLGMIYSLILKCIYLVSPPAKNSDTKEYLDLFTDIRNALLGKKNKSAISILENIHENLNNEEILEQLERSDKNNIKQLKDLNNSFTEFAEQMTENNTKSLISAIEQVMKDFNEKINDQLGEDFKELNNSIQNLVNWQNNYKSHIEKIENLFENNSRLVEQISNNINNISDQLSFYPEVNEKIKETIDNCNKQVIEFSKNSATLEEIRKQAEISVSNSIDSLEHYTKETKNMLNELIDENQNYSTNIQENFEEISNLAISTQDEIKKSLENNTEYFDKYREETQGIINDFSSTMATTFKDNTENITNVVNNQLNQITEHFDNQSTKMSDSINKFDSNFESIINRADQNFQDRLNELDKSLQEELGRSMNIISNKVASLTEKFVDDWAIIVTKSRELLSK